MRWEGVRVQDVGESSGPGKRWGHTCNAIKGGRLLYVFGGYGEDNCQTNQVHVFDTVKQTWSHPVMKGIPPTPRDSHSCTTVGDNLFVFGGTDGLNPLRDLHILDTSSHTWISPTIRGEGPEAREGHSAALVGKRLFIFGGCGKSLDNNEEIYYNDLYILNTETFVWKSATTTGTPPSPRDSHTCSSWKGKVIVIGGEDGHDYYLSDVHILDTDTLIWRELSTSGQILPPRAGHSTVAFGKNLFVFGGFTDAQNLYNDLYVLDVDSGLWTRVITIGDGPSARFSVAGDCLDPFKGGVLVFMGGCNKNLEALDDMYYLYTGLVRDREQRLEKLSLRKQLKLKCQGQNLNPVHDEAMVRYGTGSDIFQPNTMPIYSQPGKITFEAKVTESISEGYTIETVIDGKPLRGILFSNKAIPNHSAAQISSRKRAAGETAGIVSNGVHSGQLNTSKLLKLDSTEDRHSDAAQANRLPQHESQTEASADPVSENRVTSDAFEPHKVSANPEPLAVSLNQKDDIKDNSPATNSISENPRVGKTNDVLSSNNEIQTDDRTSDAPSGNTECLKSVAVKDAGTSSPNEDINSRDDKMPSSVEEQSEPAKQVDVETS